MAKSASRGASKKTSENQHSQGSGLLATGFVLGILATFGGQWILRSGFTGNGLPDQITAAVESADEFEFYTLLGNMEVEVPKVSLISAEDDDLIYWLQASSFRDPNDAENLRVSLLLKNMEAEIKPFSHDGAIWHRVIVGPFQTKTVMNTAKENLLQAGMHPIALSQDPFE